MEFTGALGLPLIGAALHPLLGVLIQRATTIGVRMSVILGVANLMTFTTFYFYLDPDFSAAFGYYDLLAVLNGMLFFGGQWFSIQSVRKGDLVVHSSALGFKVLLVAALSASVGLEQAGAGLIGGALLAAAAVYLVAGATVERFKANGMTLWLTLLACVFFGLNDFLTGWKNQEIGGHRWLILMMSTSALMSLVMLISRHKDVLRAFGEKKPAVLILSAGLALSMQALAVNLAFSVYREPALSNIAFSTRGVMAVFFVWAVMNRCKEPLGARQLIGAILMVVALGLVLV